MKENLEQLLNEQNLRLSQIAEQRDSLTKIRFAELKTEQADAMEAIKNLEQATPNDETALTYAKAVLGMIEKEITEIQGKLGAEATPQPPELSEKKPKEDRKTRFIIKIPAKKETQPAEIAPTPVLEKTAPDTLPEISEDWTEEEEAVLLEVQETIKKIQKRMEELEKMTSLELFNGFSESTLAKTDPETKEVTRENQDAYFSSPENGSFGVFDGVGGSDGGEVASSIARDLVREKISELSPEISESERESRIKEIMLMAGTAIIKKAEGDPKLKNMATTGSVVSIFKNENGDKKAIIGNIGDSRIYILTKEGKIIQITEDDSHINFKLQIKQHKGELTSKQISEIRQKLNNASKESDLDEQSKKLFYERASVTAVLGLKGSEVNMKTIELKDVSRILLCSDGISDILTDDSLEDMLINGASAKDLTKAALEGNTGFRKKSHGDDITAVVVNIN